MAQDTGIKIRIRLKAYDHKVIDQSAKQIIDTAIRTGANVAGPVPLPTRRSTYTVVKSPHVYKTGGESFEIPFPGRRECFIEIIQIKNDFPLRRGKASKIQKMAIAAALHHNSRIGRGGQIRSHDGRCTSKK